MAGNEKLMALAQQKMFIAASPKEALRMAANELNIKLSAAQEQELLSTLNGDRAFGAFDSFENSKTKTQKEVAKLGEAIKNDPASGLKKTVQNFMAEDVKKHPEKYEPQILTMKSGRYVVYQKDKKSGNESYTYYDSTGNKMTAKEFQRAEDLKQPMSFGRDKEGKLVAKAVSYVGNEEVSNWNMLNPLAWLTSCDNKDDVKELKFENFNNTSIAINVKAELGNLEVLVKQLMEKLGIDLGKILNEITNLKNSNDLNQEVIIKLLKEIMDELSKGNKTLTDIKNILLKNHEDDIEYQKRVLQLLGDIKAALYKIDSKLQAGFEGVINAIVNSGAKLDKIEALLKQLNDNVEKLGALIKKYGDAGEKLGNAILEAIKNLNFTAVVDLSGIEALLKMLVEGQQKTNDAIEKLTVLFNNFSGKTTAQLNEIIAKLDKSSPDYTELLNQIIKLLEKMDANNENRTQRILDAIEKLGVNVTAGMNAILEAIQNQPDYSARLDAILAKLEALGNKAQEILEAIKDHDVKITVDVTGKVTCECNCNCGQPHEGIIGDLEDLLN